MCEKKISSAELSVRWTGGDPPPDTDVWLCLGSAGERNNPSMLLEGSRALRGLSLAVSCAGERKHSKKRLFNLTHFGIETSDVSEEEQLNAILSRAMGLELHRTPDQDISARLVFGDGSEERFFIEEGALRFHQSPATPQ